MSESKAEQIERGREYSRLLRRGFHRMRAIGVEVLDPYGITPPQYLALLWISNHAGIIQGELAVELDSDANTMSAILRQLDSKGLIERRRHPQDGRAMSLYATKEGKQLVRKIRPKMDRISSSVLALLPPGHEAAIAEWLRSVAAVR